MYQFDSKGKIQSEKSNANTPTADKSHIQTAVKLPIKIKSLLSPSFNVEKLSPNFTSHSAQLTPITPYSPLQMQLTPKQERKEPQPLPIKLSEEPKRLAPAFAKPNNTGIPLQMKEKFENLSGFSFDDVKVHYNSDKPAQLQALAYTQGNQVYVAPGQERHLGHELGHVVQQKQGVVKPTMNINRTLINDDPLLEADANRKTIQCATIAKNKPLNNTTVKSNIVQAIKDNKNTPFARTYFAIRDAIIGNVWLKGILDHIFDGDVDANKHPTGLHAYTNGQLPHGIHITRGEIQDRVHEITYSRDGTEGEKTSTMFPARFNREEIMMIIALSINRPELTALIDAALVMPPGSRRFIDRDRILTQLGHYTLHVAGDTVYPLL